MSPPVAFQFIAEPSESGQRLDAMLAARLPEFSRTHLRHAINRAGVRVDGRHRKPSYALKAGQLIEGEIPSVEHQGPRPEEIPLDVLYEDDALIVVNKPTGMVVHPAKGHWAGTLTSALAFRFQQLSQIGGPQRPGIVHRLDRDTSGVMVVAKTDRAHLELARQFEQREVEKEYFALCQGRLDRDRDWIREPIGRHPYQREKMAIRARHATSRPAETFFEVARRWAGFVALRVFPKTGRTHQIRVHLAHISCHVLCDPLYGGRRTMTLAELLGGAAARGGQAVVLQRLALHARRLRIQHPVTAEPLEFKASIPRELDDVMQLLTEPPS